MTKNKHNNPLNSQNLSVGLPAVEQSDVEAIREVENAADIGEIEATTEDALDEFFPPEYGGSE